ncbi:ATP-dependent DNA helicase, partial [Aureobasidium melanogenum]
MYLFMYKRIFQESKSFSKMIDRDYGPFSSDSAETGFFSFSYCSNANRPCANANRRLLLPVFSTLLVLLPLSLPQRTIHQTCLSKGNGVNLISSLLFVRSSESHRSDPCNANLCFQLPACIDIGITIVVSPLLALMVGYMVAVSHMLSLTVSQNNQVAALRAASIQVATINSTVSKHVRDAIMADLKTGHPLTRLLYVTPEFCAMDHFRRVLRVVHAQKELSRIAIDEAHCISEWGHDFRPSFKELNFFKKEFPDVPMICCTATATQRVRDDIIATLHLDKRNLKHFTMTTSRPNLHYEVRYKSDEEDHYDDFLAWIKAAHARRQRPERATELAARNERPTNVPGIIYTLYRRDCEILAERLTNDGIGAKPYHAGLTNEQKDDHLSGWVANRDGYDVIVATTAFGMGIDKENVRFVVHWQIAKSFEGYYQEAGRAGRDGKASVCIVYYSREDRDRGANMLARAQEQKMRQEMGRGRNNHEYDNMNTHPDSNGRANSLLYLTKYCEATSVCRHKMIAEYFGDKTVVPCNYACDHCKDQKGLEMRKNSGLASEEWCLTQRQSYSYDEYD